MKLFLITAGLFSLNIISAQEQTDSLFKPYEQPLPGSALNIKMTSIRAGIFVLGINNAYQTV